MENIKRYFKNRGYFGLVFWQPKFEENIGIAIRSANNFGVSFIGLIGKRFKKTPQDTMSTERHIPIFEYKNLEDFLEHLPIHCEVIAVEMDGENINSFYHPQRAIYLIGGEDRNLPPSDKRIKIDTPYSLNMAVAASIVMFHRNLQFEEAIETRNVEEKLRIAQWK